jgi:hypothetical protein
VTFLAIALATAYVTYVIAKSDFPSVEWVRIKVFERWGEGSAPAYLATCAWCVSAYASALVTGGSEWLVDLDEPVTLWLAAAFTSGAMHFVLGTLEKLGTLIDRYTAWVNREMERE